MLIIEVQSAFLLSQMPVLVNLQFSRYNLLSKQQLAPQYVGAAPRGGCTTWGFFMCAQ